MARAFATIAFTPQVLDAQARMGSRDAYQAAVQGAVEVAVLSSNETDFIAARDSFYQGTVGSNGWPYVQHRGGPPGFLKVLGPTTIGYADFSGNRQYISVGNLDGDNRISLILMDYPAQRRLKIWGRARLVEEDREPGLVAKLESPAYRARVERGVLIEVEAFDWNCPKYITPRFTESQWLLRAGSLTQGVAEGQSAQSRIEETGSGPLRLVVSGIRQLTSRVRAYELRDPLLADLPAPEAGAHLLVPVRLPAGEVVTRQYSLAMSARRRDAYEIAVLNEESGRGGSAALHATWHIGTRLALQAPHNQFPLHEDDRPAVLIAGGIGITAIRAMALELKDRGTDFELHYSARTAADAAYREELRQELAGRLKLYFTRAPGAVRMDVASVLRAAPHGALFYVCGPRRLIDSVTAAANEQGIASRRVQFESFE